MTFKKFFSILAALVILGLAGCGSKSNSGPGQVRLVNATSADYDFYQNGTQLNVSNPQLPIAAKSASGYFTLTSGYYTFEVNPAHSGVNALATYRYVTDGVNSTLVAFKTQNTLQSVYLTDNQTPPPTVTDAYLRVFNGSAEAGTLDVYMVVPLTDCTTTPSLSGLTPIAGGLVAQHLSGYSEITPASGTGTYCLVVTSAGQPSDVRLNVALNPVAQQVDTLVLTSTPGGTLVDALVVVQAGTTPVVKANPSARVRLVADTTGGGQVEATVGTALTPLASPTVGSYTLIPANVAFTGIKANGNIVTTSGLSAAPGQDLTLMVYGPAASASAVLLVDDNNPSLVAGDAKIRVVDGLNNLSGNSSIALTANGLSVPGTPALGAASPYLDLVPSSASGNTNDYTLVVTTSPLTNPPLYSSPAQFPFSLLSSTVWTVWMLGDQNTSAVGYVQRDR